MLSIRIPLRARVPFVVEVVLHVALVSYIISMSAVLIKELADIDRTPLETATYAFAIITIIEVGLALVYLASTMKSKMLRRCESTSLITGALACTYETYRSLGIATVVVVSVLGIVVKIANFIRKERAKQPSRDDAYEARPYGGEY